MQQVLRVLLLPLGSTLALRFDARQDTIHFGDGAVLRASCAAGARQPKVKYLHPASVVDPSSNVSVRAYLHNVPPTCTTSDIVEPCGMSASAYRETGYPLLWTCVFAGDSATAAVGPLMAEAAAEASLGHRVFIDCPLPPLPQLKSVAGMQTDKSFGTYNLSVGVSFDGIPIASGGRYGTLSITFSPWPPSLPPLPPSLPPLVPPAGPPPPSLDCVGRPRGVFRTRGLLSPDQQMDVFCDGSNYMLVAKYNTEFNGLCGHTPRDPASTGCLGSPAIGNEVHCRIADAQLNALTWQSWKIVRDDVASGPQQPNYIIISQEGQFPVEFCAHHSAVSTRRTNGRNMRWCYLNQPPHGSRCSTLGNTNTYGVTPHEGGQGGVWNHHPSTGAGGFSCGYGSAAESSCTVTAYTIAMYACVGCRPNEI